MWMIISRISIYINRSSMLCPKLISMGEFFCDEKARFCLRCPGEQYIIYYFCFGMEYGRLTCKTKHAIVDSEWALRTTYITDTC